jgi:hypothetical protein
MTLNKLASLIAKREGLKSQASIGDIREILKIIVDIQSECMRSDVVLGEWPTLVISEQACKRNKRKKKASAK